MDTAPQVISLFDLLKPIIRYKWVFGLVLAVFLTVGIIEIHKPLIYFFSSTLLIRPSMENPEVKKEVISTLEHIQKIYPTISIIRNDQNINIYQNAPLSEFENFSMINKTIENNLKSLLGNHENKIKKNTELSTLSKKYLQEINYFEGSHNTPQSEDNLRNKIFTLSQEVNTLIAPRVDPVEISTNPNKVLINQDSTQLQTFLIFFMEGICFGLFACYLMDAIFCRKE